MLEVKGNAWDLLYKDFDALCITTNGIVKRDGTAVMGRGIALEAKQRLKGIELRLAKKLNKSGNHVYQLGMSKKKAIISFPTKYNWVDPSRIDLIKRSCIELERLIDEKGYEKVLLPRPGCNNGWLTWEQVKAEIEPLLSDRVYVVSR